MRINASTGDSHVETKAMIRSLRTGISKMDKPTWRCQQLSLAASCGNFRAHAISTSIAMSGRRHYIAIPSLPNPRDRPPLNLKAPADGDIGKRADAKTFSLMRACIRCCDARDRCRAAGQVR